MNFHGILRTIFLSLGLQTAAAQGVSINGLWLFDDPNQLNKATVGQDLAFVDSPTRPYFPQVADDAGMVLSGVVLHGGGKQHFYARHEIGPNGNEGNPSMSTSDRGKVNQYSILVDFWSPSGSRGEDRAIFQTEPANNNDADYFLDDDVDLGTAHLGWGSDLIDERLWNRLVVTVDLMRSGEDVLTYINGSLKKAHANQDVNGRYSLEPEGILFFADNDNENYPLAVGAVAIFDGVLSPGQVAALGGPGTPIDPANYQPARSDWMAALPDNRSLTTMSIPGTHDTMADCRYGACVIPGVKEFTRTQDFTLEEQLRRGIRALDIRAGITGDPRFKIVHGPIDLGYDFYDVMLACANFLTDHPGETILMRLKEEESSADVAGFASLFAGYQSLTFSHPKHPAGVSFKSFFLETPNNTYPTLGAARGKIVLLDQGWSDPNAINWGANMSIQDCYDLSGGGGCPGVATPSDKANEVYNQLVRANNRAQGDQLYVNFVSYQEPKQLLLPEIAALGQNPILLNTLVNSPALTSVGVIYSDFPGQRLIDEIIAVNPTALEAPGDYPNSYQQFFEGFADGTVSFGDGSILSASIPGFVGVLGNTLKLSDDGIGGGVSAFRLPQLNGDIASGFEASFFYLIYDSQGESFDPPGDGFSFNYGPIARADEGSEEGFGKGLSLEFDTYSNGGEVVGYNIALNGVDLTPGVPNANLADGQWHFLSMVWKTEGQGSLTVWVDGVVLFDRVPTPGFAPEPSDVVAFAARTGGATQTVLVDNISIAPTVRISSVPDSDLTLGVSLSESDAGLAIELNWNAELGAIYDIYVSIDLIVWELLKSIETLGTEGTTTIYPDEGQGYQFYQIEKQPPPTFEL